VRSALISSFAAAALVCGAGAVHAQSSSDTMGKHSMEGEVTKVDAKKGWMHVKTSEGTMIVHFPPTELQDVHKGDTITVHLALKDNGQAPKK
jgi:hypothetical protein